MLLKSNFDCFRIHHKCKAECCSDFVPIPKEIYARNQNKIINKSLIALSDENNHIIASTENGKCIFLNKDFTCNIYDDRPPICAKFGDETHPMLCCSYQGKDGHIRSRQEKRKIERENTKWIEKFNKMLKKNA